MIILQGFLAGFLFYYKYFRLHIIVEDFFPRITLCLHASFFLIKVLPVACK